MALSDFMITFTEYNAFVYIIIFCWCMGELNYGKENTNWQKDNIVLAKIDSQNIRPKLKTTQVCLSS